MLHYFKIYSKTKLHSLGSQIGVVQLHMFLHIQLLCFLTYVCQFSGEGPVSDSSGVGLDYPDDLADGGRRQPESRANTSYTAVGRRHIRVRSW